MEFPGGNKNQRMRVRGTKRASAGVLKRLEKNLSNLLDDPRSLLPIISYTARRTRKDPVKRSLAECEKVIARKNDRKWLGKRMSRRRGDTVARALAGSLHAAHDDERSMVAVFNHPIFGSASFVRRGTGKQTTLVSFQNHPHPRQRLLAWEDHARSGWWFFSVEDGIVCTGHEPKPPDGWLEESLADVPFKMTIRDGVHCSKDAAPGRDDCLLFKVGDESVALAESDLSGVTGEESFARSVALRMLPPKLSVFAEVEWGWRPEGWPEDEPLPEAAQEKVDEVIDAWLNLSLMDSGLMPALRKALCLNLDVGCIIGERWWSMDDLSLMLDAMSGSPPEKAAMKLILTAALEEGGLTVRSDGKAEEIDAPVLRLTESSCHANLVALWPDWGDLVLEEIYGIVGEAAADIIERQTKRKQGFGAFLKKMEVERAEHLLTDRFPWGDGELSGLCGRADALVRKARISGVGGTINLARKEGALGWAWVNVHERVESEGWRFESDAKDKGGDWVPALKTLFEASGVLAEGGGSEAYVEAMQALATRTGTSLEDSES